MKFQEIGGDSNCMKGYSNTFKYIQRLGFCSFVTLIKLLSTTYGLETQLVEIRLASKCQVFVS